jgi:hypothetical protein
LLKNLANLKLTRTRRRRSVENIEMKGATLERAKVIVAKAVSVLTLLALVVAPACTPLCAARFCSLAPPAVGTESHCHLSGTTNESTAHIHGVQNCGAPRVQAATLTNTSWRESLQKDRAMVSDGGLDILSAAHHFPSQNHGTVRGAPTGPPQSSHSPADTVVLRI